MATNPTITPNWSAAASQYTVAASDTAYFDLRVAAGNDAGEFAITAPAGSEVHAWRQYGGEPALRWVPAGIEATLLTGGAWAAAATLLGWSVSVSAGPAATDEALITVQAQPATGGPLRIRVTGIRSIDPAGSATLHAQSNVTVQRIVADPTIAGTPGPTVSPVIAASLVTLSGNPQVTQQAAPVVAPEFGLVPAARGDWSRVNGALAFMLTPSGASGATFTAPSVPASSNETFEFKAFYDLDGLGSFNPGEPDNTDQITVSIEPLTNRMVLVLDRSGSMSGGLGAGPGSRWDATVRAAHAWLDLFAAFRPDAGPLAGFITFEDDTPGYGPAATPDDVTLRDPVDASPATGLSDLASFANLSAVDLGSPQTNTPIGDAMITAFAALTVTPLQPLDVCSLVLLTDGEENSGRASIRPALPAGAAVRVVDALNALPVLKSKLAVYPLGAGTSVSEDQLNGLKDLGSIGSGGGGYYRLATSTADLLHTFGEMLGDTVDAQNVNAALMTPSDWRFTTNSGESRLAAVVPWTNPASTLQLSHRPQGGAGAWTPLAAAGVTAHSRATHGILIVDLPTALGGSSTALDWKLERLEAGTPQPIDAVLVMVDLHLKLEVSFDKPVYVTGEPMRISAALNAGGLPVVGATVMAGPDVPGEGCGTFMSVAGGKAGGTTSVSDFRRRQLGETRDTSDPATAKDMVFAHLLRANGLDALPRMQSAYADGTQQLFDDGVHDEIAGDGVYANDFAGTQKEGTYTVRVLAEGLAPDGSSFVRVVTKSVFVGVLPDPTASPISVTPLASATEGMLGQVVSVTPRSRTGEYLGPGREDEVVFKTTAGIFDGPVTSRMDGSYSRTLLYRRGEDPKVSVFFGGVRLLGPEPRRRPLREIVRRLGGG
jgi:hypothetical protein